MHHIHFLNNIFGGKKNFKEHFLLNYLISPIFDQFAENAGFYTVPLSEQVGAINLIGRMIREIQISKYLPLILLYQKLNTFTFNVF